MNRMDHSDRAKDADSGREKHVTSGHLTEE
jgi:hypothetical protein